MKQLTKLMMVLFALASFWACSDDDENYPAPDMGKTDDVSYTLKRDTADVYNITRQIKSEAGLAKIVLTNVTENKVLNEVSTFSNPNDYTYNYNVDLTSYTDNTSLNLSLAVTDEAGKTTAQKFTLTVLKFSELDVKFVAEGDIICQFDKCNVAFTVVRGLIPLKTVNIYLDNQKVESFDLSLENAEKYNLSVNVDGLDAVKSYALKIEVIDEKGQVFPAEKTISRIAAKTWKEVRQATYSLIPLDDQGHPQYDGSISINGEDMMGNRPDETDMIYSLIMYESNFMGWVKVGFEYNTDKTLVTKMAIGHYSFMSEDPTALLAETVYSYVYEGTTDRLQKVTCSVDQGTATDYLTDFVYEMGNIVSYKIDGTEYKPVYAVKEGESVRVDQIGGNKVYDFERKNVNPLFMPELPAVVPVALGDYITDLMGTGKAGIENQNFSNLLYNKYLFESLKEGEAVEQTFTVGEIITDPENNVPAQAISSIVKMEIRGEQKDVEAVLKFYYKD